MDAFGNKDYICLALDKGKVQFVNRKSWEIVKAIKTGDQVYCVAYNDDQYFQCCGKSGFRVFYDINKGFKAERGKKLDFDIRSVMTSMRFGDEQYGLHADDEILTDFETDSWIKIDEERTSFYKFTFEGMD